MSLMDKIKRWVAHVLSFMWKRTPRRLRSHTSSPDTSHPGVEGIRADGGSSDLDGWVELRNSDSEVVGAVVPLDLIDSQRFRQHVALGTLDTRFRVYSARLNPAVVDQLASASAVIAQGLSAGRVYQVVGPAHLIRSLNAGTHEMLRSQGQLLGTVVEKGSRKMSGQLRFVPKGPLSVVAPLVAYQVLHAIAATTELRKINEKLDALNRSLHNLQARHEAEILGRIQWAVSALDDLFQEHANTGEYTPEMILRLSHVETTIGSLLQRTNLLVENFRSKSDSVFSESGKQGAKAAATLILEDGSQAQLDIELLVGLVAADLRVQEARIRCALEHAPVDVERRLRIAHQKVTLYQEKLKDLPSTEAVAVHAEQCLNEMSWFSRNVLARGIAHEIEVAKGLNLKDVTDGSLEEGSEIPEGYVFWRGENGRYEARALPEKLSNSKEVSNPDGSGTSG